MTWRPKHLTRTQMAERRSEGVRLLERGKTSQAEIARLLGVSPAAVSMRAKSIQNAVFKSKQDVYRTVSKQFANLRQRPDELLGCFRHAVIAINQLW